MPTEEEVLIAIRLENQESTSSELLALDVAKRLGCAADDEEFQRYLVRATSSGIIEEIDSNDQLPGPTIFRLTV